MENNYLTLKVFKYSSNWYLSVPYPGQPNAYTGVYWSSDKLDFATYLAAYIDHPRFDKNFCDMVMDQVEHFGSYLIVLPIDSVAITATTTLVVKKVIR